jgi:hypothetical protein
MKCGIQNIVEENEKTSGARLSTVPQNGTEWSFYLDKLKSEQHGVDGPNEFKWPGASYARGAKLISIFEVRLRAAVQKLQERNVLTTVTVPSPNSEPIHVATMEMATQLSAIRQSTFANLRSGFGWKR